MNNEFEKQEGLTILDEIDFDDYVKFHWIVWELDEKMYEKSFLKEFECEPNERSYIIQNKAVRLAKIYAKENKVPTHVEFLPEPKDISSNIDILRKVIYTIKPKEGVSCE